MRLVPMLTLALLACSSEPSIKPPQDQTSSTAKPGTPAGGGGGGKSPTQSPNADPASLQVAASARPRLQWKRYAALEADLASALELAPDALCTEFGSESCIRSVHLVPLGGHEPFSTGLLEPAAEPLATTPTVIDRVVLSACSRRAEQDRTDARVFKLDLNAQAPAAGDPRVSELATTLYRRFLARDPEPQELTALAELTVDDAGQPVSALEFAKLACFVVGTATEFLFF